MLYVIYNHDGSLKYTNLNEIITQGSTTTKLFVSVDGYNTSDYTALAYCILPNKTSSVIEGELTTNEDLELDGFEFALTQDETYYYGEIQMSVKIYVAGTTTILFTIPVSLTINKSGFVANSTNMTITQYTNLINSLDSKVDKTDGEYKIYGTDEDGNQTTFEWADEVELGRTVAMRKEDGNLEVNLTPISSNDATSKDYVDTELLKRTKLYQHTLTIVGDFTDNINSFVVNLWIYNNDSTEITTTSALYNAITYAMTTRGYFVASSYYDDTVCRILDVSSTGSSITIVFEHSGTLVEKEFVAVAVSDERDDY